MTHVGPRRCVAAATATVLAAVAATVCVAAFAVRAAASPVPSWSAAVPDGSVSVVASPATGTYNVSVLGRLWLVSGATSVHVDNTWFASDCAGGGSGAVKQLQLTSTSADDGSDGLGSFSRLNLEWLAPPSTPVHTSIRVYQDGLRAVVFKQAFPNGANGTALGTALSVLNELCTAFPRFSLESSPALRGADTTFDVAGGGEHPATATAATGANDVYYFTPKVFWDYDYVREPPGPGLDSGNMGGLYGGTPLMLYNASAYPTMPGVTLSPLVNFKTGFQSRPAALDHDLACGLHGRLKALPRDFAHETIMVAGNGVNGGMLEWGDALLNRHGKARPSPPACASAAADRSGAPTPHAEDHGAVDRNERHRNTAASRRLRSRIGEDTIGRYLEYATDTGGVYWYNPGTNATYESTLLALAKWHRNYGVPVRVYEADSWWYYKGAANGEAGGIKLYEPMPDVFPHGMEYMHQQLGTPLAVHSKYYSADNEYQHEYPFMVESQAAIPLTGDFWEMLMGQAAAWGVTEWKQDWLASIFELMLGPSQDVDTARNFHLQMGAAAAEAGLTMQYCMPTASDVLQSVENPAAKYIRLTDDYSTFAQQWRIGRPAILAWAVGLVALKDVFWTFSEQPLSPYGAFVESVPALNAAVASLSAGQVAIGDGIDTTNVTLVSRTCAPDGRLMRTDAPATAIDATFRAKDRPTGDVWHTTSSVSAVSPVLEAGHPHAWGASEACGGTSQPWLATSFVLAANTTQNFDVSLEDLEIAASTALRRPWRTNCSPGSSTAEYVAFDVANDTSVTTVQLVNATSPLRIPALPAVGNWTPFVVYAVAPRLRGGWALLGDTHRFVSVAPERFENVSISADGAQFSVIVLGSRDECVDIRVMAPSGRLVVASCAFGYGDDDDDVGDGRRGGGTDIVEQQRIRRHHVVCKPSGGSEPYARAAAVVSCMCGQLPPSEWS